MLNYPHKSSLKSNTNADFAKEFKFKMDYF